MHPRMCVASLDTSIVTVTKITATVTTVTIRSRYFSLPLFNLPFPSPNVLIHYSLSLPPCPVLLPLPLISSSAHDVISVKDVSKDATHMRGCIRGFESFQNECLNIIADIQGYCCLYFSEFVHRGCICPPPDLPMHRHGISRIVLSRPFAVYEIPARDRCYVSDFAGDDGWKRLANGSTALGGGDATEGGADGPPALGGGDAKEVMADGEELKGDATAGASRACFSYMVRSCRFQTLLIVIAGMLLGGFKWVLGIRDLAVD